MAKKPKNYDAMYSLLREQPKARERKSKNRAIAHILQKRYQQLAQVDKGVLADAIGEIHSLDRSWRKVTEDHEHLRGSDYDDKPRLEKEVQESLGYSTINM